MIKHLLGGLNPDQFAACVFFALVGVVISLLIHATNRDKNAPRTPVKFSFSFLLADNWQRILLNLLMILVTLRFCKEITGYDINMFVALVIGLAYDKLGELLRNKCIIDKK
jgi:hypothetical protein